MIMFELWGEYDGIGSDIHNEILESHKKHFQDHEYSIMLMFTYP